MFRVNYGYNLGCGVGFICSPTEEDKTTCVVPDLSRKTNLVAFCYYLTIYWSGQVGESMQVQQSSFFY